MGIAECGMRNAVAKGLFPTVHYSRLFGLSVRRFISLSVRQYHAEDFAFLGSATNDSSATFKGSAEAVRNFIETGSNAELARTGSESLSIEVTDKAGTSPPTCNEGGIVMRLFRVKRNDEMY
ncbi:hypothetical protein ACFLRQ_02795 [Bacteroidota bacterium]